MDQPGLGDTRPWSRGILGGRAPSLTSAFYCSHQPSLVSLLGSLAFRGPPSWLGPCFPCCLVLVLVVRGPLFAGLGAEGPAQRLALLGRSRGPVTALVSLWLSWEQM